MGGYGGRLHLIYTIYAYLLLLLFQSSALIGVFHLNIFNVFDTCTDIGGRPLGMPRSTWPTTSPQNASINEMNGLKPNTHNRKSQLEWIGCFISLFSYFKIVMKKERRKMWRWIVTKQTNNAQYMIQFRCGMTICMQTIKYYEVIRCCMALTGRANCCQKIQNENLSTKERN